MITYYRTKNPFEIDVIEDTLDEMCVPYETVNLEKDEADSVPEKNVSAPALIDQDKIIQGNEDILNYLSQLDEFRKLWYKYQSDVCYCDDEDKVL